MKLFFIKIKLIWQGWTNFIIDKISDIRYKKYFDARYEICKSCEEGKHGICEVCGCVIRMKTMSEDSECPHGKWLTIPDTLAMEKLQKRKEEK